MKIKHLIPVAAVALSCLAGCAVAQTQGGSTPALDDNTLMLLQPQADGLKDKKGAFEAAVKGGAIVPDERFGHALQFGEANGNGISVKDGGKVDFSRGLTMEMWLQLQQPDEKTPNPGGPLFVKLGSFFTSIKDNKFNVDWMVFPGVPVATTTDKQYKSYPVGGTGFPGYIPIPANRWVHLALTYDPVLKVARSWTDGKLDWTEYYPREEAMPLQNDATKALSFIGGMKNVRVGEIRVSNIARAIDTLTPFEAYAHALPYRKKSAVIFDHIQPADLPLQVVLQSGGKQLQKFSLTDPKTKTIFFDPPVPKGQYPLSIKATSNGKEVYSREVDLYAGDDTRQSIRMDDKNRLVLDGKPVFPLIMYHAFIEDVPTLAKMGFTAIGPRYPDSRTMGLPTRDAKSIAIAKQYLDAAKENNTYMYMGGGIFAAGGGSTKINEEGIKALTDHPALAFWYGADEPGRNRIRQLQSGYTAAKQIGTRPIFSVTNRSDHMPTLAESADILGSDPYPIPNISLRAVADFTRYSVNATAGLKPVWTVVPQYQYRESDNKRPTEQELRCMAYLAIASGAQGLGIYAWDDRDAITKKGWYTKEHPEDVKILETIIGELNALQNVLIIPNSARALTFAPANPALHAALKEDGNDNYLMVVSDSRKAEEATLSIAGLKSADGVDVHDATAKLSIRDGKVVVQLPPLGTRLYNHWC
jgi:hypothetical protein